MAELATGHGESAGGDSGGGKKGIISEAGHDTKDFLEGIIDWEAVLAWDSGLKAFPDSVGQVQDLAEAGEKKGGKALTGGGGGGGGGTAKEHHA